MQVALAAEGASASRTRHLRVGAMHQIGTEGSLKASYEIVALSLRCYGI